MAGGWPRYNASDAGFNGAGNHGYGAYGENVGIGNLDDDPQVEIVVTFDYHQINLFNDDGTSVLASPWYTNRRNGFVGRRLGWGQFIRWLSPAVEDDHYHRHVGEWPSPRTQMWLQWTASPPTVADLDRDGRTGIRRGSYDYAHRAPKTFASEVVAADLNRDGRPELVFGTYALAPGSGWLIVLSPTGKKLYDIRLSRQGRDGNGIGVPAAPSIGDVDGDGRLEIVLSSFDHGIDVFRVPGSDAKCLPWPTGRGNLLRNGTAP